MGGPPEQEADHRDDQQIADENVIHAAVATTIPGVVARLLEAIPHLNEDRWVDRDLAEHGLLALNRARKDLNPFDGALVQAAHELLHIEWRRSLAAYEKAHGDFEAILTLKSLIEAEQFRTKGEPVSAFLTSLELMMDRLEERFSDEAEIQAVVCTLAPDHDAYRRKVEIIVDEGVEGSAGDVTPWLARDTAFLLGGADRAMKKAA